MQKGVFVVDCEDNVNQCWDSAKQKSIRERETLDTLYNKMNSDCSFQQMCMLVSV